MLPERTALCTVWFRNLWLFGAVVFLIYGAAVYLFLRRRLRFATKWDGIVYESGEIRSPFVFGIVRPRIYLPCGLTEGERECICVMSGSIYEEGIIWSSCLHTCCFPFIGSIRWCGRHIF